MECSLLHVYSTKTKRQKSVRRATSVYLLEKERKDLMSSCGDAALILYEYYLKKAGIDGYTYQDELVARGLGWNSHKVKQNRLKLTKEQYFLQINGKLNDKRKITVTYLHPQEIHEVNALIDNPEFVSRLLAENAVTP